MIGFWIFMLAMNLLIPLTMVGFGNCFVKKIPKEINSIFGYRTKMSTKNKDTWEFAHHYCGKYWISIGRILFPLSIIAMLFVFGKDIDSIGKYGGVICFLQLILLVATIFLTEAALKRTFDENGHRKK